MSKRGPVKATEPAPAGAEPSPLVTYREAGQMLRVDPRTIRTWVDEGRLIRVRLTAQTVRVTRASVFALIEACTE